MNQSITKNKKRNYLFVMLVIFCAFIMFIYSAGASSNNSTNQKNPEDVNQVPAYETKNLNNLFSSDPNYAGKSSITGTEIYYKLMLSVVFIIILGAAAVFMTKKFFPNIAKMQGKKIKVVETVHLGPRKSVHIIEIENRRFLIGSTNENIRKLADLTEFSSSMPIQEDELG